MLAINCDKKRTLATYTSVTLVVMKQSFEKAKDLQVNNTKKKREKKLLKRNLI
jgi:hypothetical protein